MRSLLIVSAIAFAVAAPMARAGEGGSEQPLEAGHRIYQSYCASCHGARGEGEPHWQQRNVQGELPAPPHNQEGHTWKHADGMLYRIIRDGWRNPFNKTSRLTMPAFGQTLSPQEIRAVIEYLKTLWTPEQRRFQADESRQAPYPPESNQKVPSQPW